MPLYIVWIACLMLCLSCQYKEAEKINTQLESALEKQQDKASSRTKDLIADHKKDLLAKDKLSDAIRRRNESLQGEMITLQERVEQMNRLDL